jgi:hypothetical protein
MMVHSSEGRKGQAVPVGPVGGVKSNSVTKITVVCPGSWISPQHVARKLTVIPLECIKEIGVLTLHLPQIIQKELDVSFHASLTIVPHVIPAIDLCKSNFANPTILLN